MADSPPAPLSQPQPQPQPLRLRLHGTPQLALGSRQLALERKAAGALAWLALRGPVLRLRLAELLWPAATAEGARNNLRQLVFKLKKALDTAVIEGGEELQLPPSVLVEPAAGDLLEGCEYDDCPDFAAWLAEARAAHRRTRAAARLAEADHALAAGEAEGALALARAAVAEDELSEPAHLRIVQALYLMGDRAGALAAAAQCEARLREALGVEPSQAMQDLVATLRRSAAPAGGGPPAVPAAVLRPPRLVGRARELAWLGEGREGRVALLAGEPGLGKSRLLAEACSRQAGGCLLATRPGDAAVPYAALARWVRTWHEAWPAALQPLPPVLRRLLPEHTPAAPAADAPRARQGLALRDALVTVLVRSGAAGLTGLWIDDLHFADEASVEALLALLGEPALAGLSFTLARRPAEGGEALGRLADTLLDEDRLLPITLAPLDEARVHELLASLALPELDPARWAGDLHRRTGGNPLFLLETVKTMLLDGAADFGDGRMARPRSVTALIERRLRQLSAPALALARVAALAGPDFGTELAMAVLQVPLMSLADAWAELEAAQVLHEQAFAHDLIYEVTLAGVPRPIRRHARRAIAEFLAPRDAEPARLAEHWLAAGEPAQAAPHFEAAGRRAEAAARYAEAQALFERAAACHDEAGHAALAFDTRLALADLLMESNLFAASQAALDRLFAGATIDQKWRARMQLMSLLMRQGRFADACTLGQATLADEDLLEDALPRRVAEMRWHVACAMLHLAQHGPALHQLQLAEPELAQAADPTWRCWFNSQVALALSHLGEAAQSAAAQEPALAAAREVGRRRMIAGCLQNGVTMAVHRGRLVEALDLADEALLLMHDAGDNHFSGHVQVQRSQVLMGLGRYGEAIEVLEAAVDDADVARATRVRAQLAECWALVGQAARARRLLAATERDDATLPGRTRLALARCQVAWLAGEDAEPWLAEAAAVEGDRFPHVCRFLIWRQHAGRVDLAALAAWRARWEAAGVDGHVVAADLFAAMAAHARGEPAAAAQWVARAMPALRRALPVFLHRPWAYLALARAAEGAAPDLARRAAEEGADWLRNVARFQLPEALRDSFLHRNRIHAELLALAARRTR